MSTRELSPRAALVTILITNTWLSGCGGPPPEKLDPSSAIRPDDARLPPPPPPPAVAHVPPPEPIAAFFAAEGVEPKGAWLYELPDQNGSTATNTFLGYPVRRKRTLSDDIDRGLRARMATDVAYINGDYGCFTEPVGLELKGTASNLRMIVNCGHLKLEHSRDDHADAILSEEMIDYLSTFHRMP